MTDSSGGVPDSSGQVLVLSVEPGEEEWGSREDDRWREDLLELRKTLENNAPEAVEPAPAEEGSMGIALVPIIIALGHAGVFTAMVSGLKAWLSERPKRRTATVTVRVGDTVKTLTVTAENIDSSDLIALGKAALGEGA